jgi:hypothetical protein
MRAVCKITTLTLKKAPLPNYHCVGERRGDFSVIELPLTSKKAGKLTIFLDISSG